MKHLFIINPSAAKVKGRVDAIKSEIESFFQAYPDISYHIYISSWCRDAVAYIRRYITGDKSLMPEKIRVHAVGGSGTLFEVVNGVINIDNAEIAAYPFGKANVFLRYFGDDKLTLFSEISRQIFADSIPIDVIRCGSNYGISYGIVGFEAACAAKGDRMIERGLPDDISYLASALPSLMLGKDIFGNYRLDIDGKGFDGRYLSVMIANTPCYGQRFHPASNAHPDDGRLEVYAIRPQSRITHLLTTAPYLKGDYQNEKLDFIVLRHTGRKITISAEETMCMNIDSETFYNTSAEFELLPGAVRFACPKQIELGKLPLIYNNPKGGTRNGL